MNVRVSGPGGERPRRGTPKEGAIVGRFELLELVGEGRLGQVWQVRDMGTGMHYALRLFADPPSDTISRLEADVRAWHWLRQRNLVPIQEILDDAGLIGVISPFVEGTPLAVVLQDGAAMDLSEAIPLFRAILDALSSAHAAGRLHGELTPATILLEIDEVRITPRLTDVGLSAALGLPVETVPERARYVAPEVGVDGGPTVAADVFAAGVVLYEMVAGRSPFEDRPLVENGAIPYTPLDHAVLDCPPEVARAVDTALSVDPARRFTSVVAFKMALAPVDRWIAEEPTQPLAVLDWGEPPPPRTPVRSRPLAQVEPERPAAPRQAPVRRGLAEVDLSDDLESVEQTEPSAFRRRRPGESFPEVEDDVVSEEVPLADAREDEPLAEDPSFDDEIDDEDPPSVVPSVVAAPPKRPDPIPLAPASLVPRPVVPVPPRKRENEGKVVISLDAADVNEANPELVRELTELNARPSLFARGATVVFTAIVAPSVLAIILVLVLSWRAGDALYEARTAEAEARASVDRDLAAAAGQVERLVTLGARRDVLEAPFFSAVDAKDLATRTQALGSLKDALGSAVRNLPKLTKPEDVLAQRSLTKAIDTMGADEEAHLAVAGLLAEAEAMPLAAFADRWGFAEADPLTAVPERVAASFRTTPAEAP